MSSITTARRLIDPHFTTARSSIPLPLPLDVDLAPQLLIVALAQAALAATHRALDSAHPILASLSSPRTNPPHLTDPEHFAVLVMHAGNELAELLSAYNAAVVRDNIHDDDDTPF
jgi:hypothetical protein